MSRVYDNWEKLVGAVLKRRQHREIALCESFNSSTTADFSSSRFSIDSSFQDVVVSDMEFDSENFLKEFYIPSYILNPQAKVECLPDVPECPVLVFINSTSGGQLGGDLLITYRTVLNKDQVFDLGVEAPDSVLRRVFLNLEMLKNNGDEFVPKLEEKLKIVVAGGDGTAGWLLGVLSDLKLSRPPPVATVPLGTENNVPFAFGWVRKSRHSAVY